MFAHISTMHIQYKMEKVSIKTIHLKLTICRLRCFVLKRSTFTGNIGQDVYRKQSFVLLQSPQISSMIQQIPGRLVALIYMYTCLSGSKFNKYLVVLLFQYKQIRS